jgi:CRISPR system Cascade subunit CasB
MDAVIPDQKAQQKSWEARFVNAVIDLCQQDKGAAARFRRADNPATEYQSWELLARLGINLENERERLPAVTVVADIARAKVERNGQARLGQALAACYENSRSEENKNNPAKARLRRLLACTELPELVRHLRPVLALIHSKSGASLDYERLLRQLNLFVADPQRIRAQWAQEFYGQSAEQTAEVAL